MYACILETGADFSRRCAPPMIARAFFLTTPLTIRDVTRAMPATTMMSGPGKTFPAPLDRVDEVPPSLRS